MVTIQLDIDTYAWLISFLLNLYVSYNCFLAGMVYKEYSFYEESWKEHVGKMITMFFFGCIIMVIKLVVFVIRKSAHWIEGTFKVSFFFEFYFTKIWDKMDLKKLKELNTRCHLHRQSNSLSDRIHRHCMKMVNKLRKYEFVYEEPKF